MRAQLQPVFQGSEYRERPTMKKQTTVKMTAMARGTFGVHKQEARLGSGHGRRRTMHHADTPTDLKRPRVERKAISVDEHPQGRQGDEEPASEGGKVDELVDFSRGDGEDHQGVLGTHRQRSYTRRRVNRPLMVRFHHLTLDKNHV